MEEMEFVLYMILNIPIVVAYFTEYIWSLFLYKHRLKAEVVGFEEDLHGDGRGMRNDYYTLIFYKICEVPNTVMIRRDRRDFIGRKITVCYSVNTNTVLRNSILKFYYMDSLVVQILFWGLCSCFVALDLFLQFRNFSYISKELYIPLGGIALFSGVIVFWLASIYISWNQKRLNG